jgi:hypothetical protein
MLPYAKLTPGPGFEARRALFYYAQRMVTAPLARRTVASLIAAAVRRDHGAAEWPLDNRGEQALAELRRDGIAVLEPLSETRAAAMADYFRAQPVVTASGELTSLEQLTPDAATAGYSLETVLRCPGLVSLLNSPDFLGLAAGYLGCKPTLSSVGVRWTFPSTGAARFQGYHRDLDDWRFLKLFIYLTDVDADCGPHTYVRRSHVTAFGVTAPTYTEAGLASRFGSDSLATITGPRGETFIADTIGVHRAGRPRLRPRLMLQVQYSLLPVYAFLYRPWESDCDDLDLYCNRLLLQETAAEGAQMAARPDGHQFGETGPPAASTRRARTLGATSEGRSSGAKKSAASISRPQAGSQARQEPAS